MQELKIAFAGKMRAGKDTAVDHFMKRFPDALHLKFADPLYDIKNYICRVAGFDEKEKHRELLMWLGTDYCRRLNPKVWVDNLLLRSNLKSRLAPIQLVSDARFKNEFEALKAAGWFLVKIERPDIERLKFGATWGRFTWLAKRLIKVANAFEVKYLSFLRFFSHSSERDMDSFKEWDCIIYNEEQLADYYIKLERMIREMSAEGGNTEMKPWIM